MSLNSPNKDNFIAEVTKFRRELLRVARQYCVIDGEDEDIVQDAIMQCYDTLDRFDPELSSLKSWVTRMVISAAIDVTRREKRRRTMSIIQTDFPDTEHTEDTRRAKMKPKPEEEPGYDPKLDLRISVHQALASLSDIKRQLAEAVLLRGETLEDYAADHNISISHVRRKLDVVKANLRRLLKEFKD